MNVFILILVIINIIATIYSIILNKASRNSKEIGNILSSQTKYIEKLENEIHNEFSRNRQEVNNVETGSRLEMSNSLKNMTEGIQGQLKNMAIAQNTRLQGFQQELSNLTSASEMRLAKMRDTIEEKLYSIQMDNNKKLDEMRVTVDEKLHESLEKRLSESFSNMNERLENLYKQMGEIGSLASGVNDLKRALNNVKVRGIFGEIQLKAILTDILTKDQYEENVITKKDSRDRVEFAIKIPSKDQVEKYILLPIDSKFPQEDYQRLMDAETNGNKEQMDIFKKALLSRIKKEAQDIMTKYIDPPSTTDFGILFLPTESLYSEVVKEPGLMEEVQRQYRVVITGPSTVSAFLNSLQMGFRTLSIEKRSSEVWQILGAVKTEFVKFGEILDKTQKKLQEASNTIETASRKSRNIERKLKLVEGISQEETEEILED